MGVSGGIIDGEENAQAAAIRELMEETGIDQGKIKFIVSKKFLITKPEENVRITAYLAKIIHKVKITLDSYEHVDYKWVSSDNISETKDLMPGVPTILKNLLRLENMIDSTMVKPNKIELVDIDSTFN